MSDSDKKIAVPINPNVFGKVWPDVGTKKEIPAKDDPENYLKFYGEFEKTFTLFYAEEPFLGAVSCDITKKADPNCRTAYIAIGRNGKRPEIIIGYSPKLMRHLVDEEKTGVLKHEIYHLILGHVTYRYVSDPKEQKMQNWAQDLAINSIIGADKLPDFCLIPGKHPKDPIKGTPIEGPYADFIERTKPLEASDYYFEEFRKIRQKHGDDGLELSFGMGSMDDHDMWGEIDPDVANEIKDKINNLVDRAVKRADSRDQWGTVPQSIREMIRKLYSHEVDWKSVVRNFIGRSRSVQRNPTLKKINKKVPYIYPGVRRPLIANFACFIDQSGSMSDEDIAMLFGELQQLSALTEIDTYHFDTAIDFDSHMTWKKGNEFPKTLRTRCGGTNFDCIADFINDRRNQGRYSGIIILTDGYAPKMKAVRGARTLWVITPGGTMEHIRGGDLVVKMRSGSSKFKPY